MPRIPPCHITLGQAKWAGLEDYWENIGALGLYDTLPGLAGECEWCYREGMSTWQWAAFWPSQVWSTRTGRKIRRIPFLFHQEYSRMQQDPLLHLAASLSTRCLGVQQGHCGADFSSSTEQTVAQISDYM